MSYYLVSVVEAWRAVLRGRGCIKRTHPYPYGNIVYSNAKENKDASENGSRVEFFGPVTTDCPRSSMTIVPDTGR